LNEKKTDIFVFGAGGHAKVVIDIIEKQCIYTIAFLFDDNFALKGENIYGYTVAGGKSDLDEICKSAGVSKGIVAVGNNYVRHKIAAWLEEKGFSLITAVHPFSVFGRGATIGKGSVVMAGTVVNSDTIIGSNAIINTKASIDHDCILGESVHIAPGSTLCGEVNVGDGTFVGAGAVIIPCCTIGRDVTIGAGSVVVKDVPDSVTVVGVPARIVGL
jgi:sugar O-acyltransferase (sialic acid O-acetyltransferase NeuD family)